MAAKRDANGKFLPGSVANPKGRPPKDCSLTSLLKEEIDKVPPDEKQGRTWRQLLVGAWLSGAMKNPVLLKELLETGFRATIVVVKDGVLDTQFLGKTLNVETIREMETTGIDISGEEGEYHTVVTDGPIFSFPLQLNIKGRFLRDGYWFLDVSAKRSC